MTWRQRVTDGIRLARALIPSWGQRPSRAPRRRAEGEHRRAQGRLLKGRTHWDRRAARWWRVIRLWVGRIFAACAIIASVTGVVIAVNDLRTVAPLVQPPSVVDRTNPLNDPFTFTNNSSWVTLYNVMPTCVIEYAEWANGLRADVYLRRSRTRGGAISQGQRGKLVRYDQEHRERIRCRRHILQAVVELEGTVAIARHKAVDGSSASFAHAGLDVRSDRWLPQRLAAHLLAASIKQKLVVADTPALVSMRIVGPGR
jgi:hypothetical protein